MLIPSKVIDSCRLCSSRDLDLLLDYGLMPLAGGFVVAGDPRANAKAPLRLGQCNTCGLVQVLDSIEPDRIFGTYSYMSGASPALVRHFQQLATILSPIMGLLKIPPVMANVTPLVVDIGCNDGTLLKEMRSRNWRIAGIDPSDVALRASREDRWYLYNGYANRAAADDILSLHGKASIVTACNVLAHTDNIHDMIECAAWLLDHHGTFVVEVQDRQALARRVQFDTVYHEHCSYFGINDLSLVLQQHGFKVWHATEIPNHSGSLRVFASLDSGRESSPRLKMLQQQDEQFDGLRFAGRADEARKRLEYVFSLLWQAGAACVAYGAAGRATILMNWCGLTTDHIQYVVDDSPLRQGKVVPGVAVPIVSTEGLLNPPDTFYTAPEMVLITAWNYAESIIEKHRDYLGRWMTPLPEVTIL